MRNITEQCTERQRQLYINYVDYEKASTASTENFYGAYLGHMEFHDRSSLVIKSFYNNFKNPSNSKLRSVAFRRELFQLETHFSEFQREANSLLACLANQDQVIMPS